jgi:hypothetical protein
VLPVGHVAAGGAGLARVVARIGFQTPDGGAAVGDGSRVGVGGTWVSVGSGGIVTISVGLAQPTRIAIKNKTNIISRTGLRNIFPPFDLGNPQISCLYNTITLFRVNFKRFGKVDFLSNCHPFMQEISTPNANTMANC